MHKQGVSRFFLNDTFQLTLAVKSVVQAEDVYFFLKINKKIIFKETVNNGTAPKICQIRKFYSCSGFDYYFNLVIDISGNIFPVIISQKNLPLGDKNIFN